MKLKPLLLNLFFPLIGIGATIWFLIRVIPKPSRATYPCMRVAYPLASAFVVYLLGLAASAFAIGKMKDHWKNSRYWAMAGFLLIALLAGFFTFQADQPPVYANTVSIDTANAPIGIGKGTFSGRVVWVHNPAAVNQACTNSTGDYWLQDNNTHQTAVDDMVSNAIRTLTGKGSDAESWDAIFRYYNQTHSRGNAGYTAGEKIVIKCNFNTGASGTSYTRADLKTVDTSPQIAYAILHQLVNVAGVAQADINIGDPGRNFDDVYWNKCHPDFPNVKYWGNGNGRTPITQSANLELKTSDDQIENYLPACYVDATYLINIPVFKQHHRAGISLSSKNHFGTLLRFSSDGTAFPYHYSLPCTQGNGIVDNGGYGKYRIFVDFIGHKDLGGKTILYLFDALWSSTNYGDPPWKWRMAPFNNTYPASIFASQDAVAIESVGYDFMRAEFSSGNPSGNAFPQYSGVDDFLRQAADSVNWPTGIKYDPEGDGTYLPRSMGVNEHWDNATDQKYTRDLGTGTGIELVKIQITTSVDGSLSKSRPSEFILEPNYPNPFNPSTIITYNLPQSAHVDLSIYNIQGQCIQKLVDTYQTGGTYSVQWNGRVKGKAASSGIYFARFNTESKQGAQSQVQRMVLLK
jgi:hypothetical protein